MVSAAFKFNIPLLTTTILNFKFKFKSNNCLRSKQGLEHSFSIRIESIPDAN